MSQYFSGDYRGHWKGADIPNNVKTKGNEQMHLVPVAVHIKSSEMPVSSLVAQAIRRLPAAASRASELPSSNDRGYLFCDAGCL